MKNLLLILSLSLLPLGLDAQVYFFDDFSSGNLNNWTLVDSDGDGSQWMVRDYNDGVQEEHASSASWNSSSEAPVGVLTPDNWMISSAISIPTGVTNVYLSWKVYAQDQSWADENYTVYVATANDVATLSASTVNFNEVIGTSTGYLNRTLDVSSFAGQTIHVGFRHHNVTDQFRMNIDDVAVKQVLNDDAHLTGIGLVRWAMLNANETLSAEVVNEGGNAITSLEIDWNDGTSHVQTVSVNIAPGASVTVDHPDAVSYATAVEQNINVTITAVNGTADSDPSNNILSGILHNTLSQQTDKAVVIEEGTGTWCGWCPRGAVAMEHMVNTYPNDFIGVAVHNGDPMTVTEYDNGAGISGFPGANVDRALLGVSVSQAAFEAYYNDRINMGVPANVGATVTGTGANVTIDASASFYTPIFAADFRLAVVISENGVTGTTSDYDQVNYYSGGGEGQMGGYENLANPVPAADMVYDHVGVALLGGYNGQAGSVPATITDGTVANYTFNYTVPATSNRANMYAIVLLLDNATGEIVNATEVSIAEGGNVAVADVNTIDMNVYPNPATDNVDVAFEAAGDYTITITDMAGRVVSTNAYTNLSGAQNITIPVADLMSGNYIISVANEVASYNQALVIK
jgi:thiol-disulfide isomerase/thioredoxin